MSTNRGGHTFERRTTKATSGDITQLPCDDLEDRLNDLALAARSLPVNIQVAFRLRSMWRRAARRLVFAGRQSECITETSKRNLNDVIDTLAADLGDMDVGNSIATYEQAVQEAFHESPRSGAEHLTTKTVDRPDSDMATNENACRRAVMASQEVILENCDDVEGSVEEIGRDVFAFVPSDARDEFDFDLNGPKTDAEVAEAIRSCMESRWAEDWADNVLGPDAASEAVEAAKRRACEGLFK